MAAALQQAPITFQSRSPPSVGTTSPGPQRFSFSSSLRPKFTLKITQKSRSRRGGSALGATMSSGAATNYATALAEIAFESDSLESYVGDVQKIENVFSDPAVYSFFISPIVLLDEKRAVIDDIVSTAQLQPETGNFLKVLVDNYRIDIIQEIVKEFDLVYNVLTGTQMALVTSVVPLESQQLAQIAKEVQKLTGAKNVRIQTAIDKSLVAGFTIKYGATLSNTIDMSVKKQLEEIAAELELPEVQLAV